MPKSGVLIDLRNKVVMPGLIDFHIHIEQEFTANSRLNGYILNEADVAYNSVNFTEVTKNRSIKIPEISKK